MELEENLYWVPLVEHSLLAGLMTEYRCFRCKLNYQYVDRFDDLHAGECDVVGCNAL